MSFKSGVNSSIKSNCETPHWARSQSTETNVKFAGEEAKDRLYEPKHKKKLVRVLTVVAYIFSVSLAAIMLSLYYVFLYPKANKELTETTTISAAERDVNDIFIQSLQKEFDHPTYVTFYQEPTQEPMGKYATPSSKNEKSFMQMLKSTDDANYLNDIYN